jgi:hypothetical protein
MKADLILRENWARVSSETIGSAGSVLRSA